MAKMIDRELRAAAGYCLLLAALTFFGIVHSAVPDGNMYLPWRLAAPLQRAQKPRHIRLFAWQRGEIDDNRASGEERRRAGDLRIERIQPVGQRRLRRENQRHERPATDSDERTRIGCGHLSGVSAEAPRVNQNCQRLRCKKNELWIIHQALWKSCLRAPPDRRIALRHPGDSTWMTRLAIMSRVLAP